jgi:hypothetical protein
MFSKMRIKTTDKGIELKHIHRSVIIIGGQSALEEEVRNFDLAEKTPVECLEFVRKLRNRIKVSTYVKI